MAGPCLVCLLLPNPAVSGCVCLAASEGRRVAPLGGPRYGRVRERAHLRPCTQSEVSSVPFCLPCWHAAVCRPHTLNSTSTSKSFQSTVTGELNAPYSKQFVHSKSSQYRKMKTEWKSNVYLARSRIQVGGDFVLRNRGQGGNQRWGDTDMWPVDKGFTWLQEQDPLFDTTSHLVSLCHGRCTFGGHTQGSRWHGSGHTGFVESSLEVFHVKRERQ